MKRPQKAVVYVVRGRELLVFVHADDLSFDQSGLQVPAGTVEQGELPSAAALREVEEETGLQGFRIVRYLGAGEYDMRPYAESVHVRHFFHAEPEHDLPDEWTGCERGDGTDDPINFRFYWLPIAQGHVLAAGQGAFLGRLQEQP